MYDINCGSEIKIAENHSLYQNTPIKINNSALAVAAVRARRTRAR